MPAEPEIITVDTDGLDALLAQARAEAWEKLFLGSGAWPDDGLRHWHRAGGFQGRIVKLSGDRDSLAARLGIVGELSSLRRLALLSFGIGDDGARAIASLTNLTSLDLGDNSIGVDGAHAIASLTNLTSLNLGDNDIEETGIRHLLDRHCDADPPTPLDRLDLRNNPGLEKVLPSEVMESWDARAILAAYRRYRDAEGRGTLEALNEAKLLVVGNEAVGKTSLVRYLVENKPRDPAEKKTPGAAIHEKIDVAHWTPAESETVLNVWDFGGQEVMRGTHRYFLTERSLYLLVLEDRREDDPPVHDWLRNIRNRGGDSPVIVVINKSDEGKAALQLAEDELKAEYPNIVGFLRTSCDPGAWAKNSIQALRETIASVIADDPRLSHVRDRMPTSWLRVKETVTGRARGDSVLEFGRFEGLCLEAEEPAEAITDPDEQRALLRLLHDLGTVVAHGLEEGAPASMRRITLLDPNWLTTAIYTILNEPTVLRDQAGEFEAGQLNDWLDPAAYPEAWHEFILDMMTDEEIGLYFELPHARGHYLIPEAMSPNAPNLAWWPEDSLRFRYRYDFLPRRLVTSLIVHAHELLADPPIRWRTGAVFDAARCRVLVRAHGEHRRLEIEVAGPGGSRRSALNIVLDHLEHIHRQNPEVNPVARVPLPDQPDADVGYEHLLKLEQLHGLDYEFLPEDGDRPHSVGELLEGVRRAASRFGEPDMRDKQFSIATGSHSQVSIIDGDNNTVSISSTGTEAPHDAKAETPPAPPQTPWYKDWTIISIDIGMIAVLLAVALWYMPDGNTRLVAAVLLAVFAVVTAIVLSRNPENYYRRKISFLLPLAVLLPAVGSLDVLVVSEPLITIIRKADAGTPWLLGALTIIIVAFGLYDSFLNRPDGRR